MSARKQLIELIEQGCVPSDRVDEALLATKVLPENREWLQFVDHLLAWIGGLAIAFAAMFFIAYNWDDLGRFAKFGMVEALLLATILIYWKLGREKITSKIALLMASIFLGVLLALFGQTYQTGADPWQLFFNWSLLMLPWAIIGRFSAIWILWISLINLSIVLYFTAFRGAIFFIVGSGETGMLWALFIFNTIALIVWELLSNRWQWLEERWAPRLIAIGSGVTITWLVIYVIFDDRHYAGLTALVWAAWLVAFYFIYRKIRQDLFMLAGISLSAIIVVICFMVKNIFESSSFDAGIFLLIAIMIIGMGTGAAIWLRNVHREFQS
jgi:uncharacterized membrane protein